MTISGDAPQGVMEAARLTSVFGGWPSFHDAEVVRMVLDRGEGTRRPSLTVDIYVFDMTREVDERGYFRLLNRSVATFEFGGVALDQIRWFNEQNVLADLLIEPLDASANEGCLFRVLHVRPA